MNATLAARLTRQALAGAPLADPAAVVTALCAVQAQDYRGALWAIAQRCGASEAEVEAAVTAGTIVRTWPMRGTLHFVARDDARWITRLFGPKILARAGARHRELGLDGKTIAKARTLLERALAAGPLTREATYEALDRGEVSTEGQRGIHLIGALALDGVLCYGPPRGKQQTFVLLDQWVPRSRAFADRDEAIAELARRYLASHGPATLEDLVWWTGLTLTEARRALAALGVEQRGELLAVDGVTARAIRGAVAHLLPAYDEYTVGYRDRSAFLPAHHATRARNGIFSPVVLLGGAIAGVWKRARKPKRTDLSIELFEPASKPEQAALERVAARYGEFLGDPVAVSFARSRT